MRKIGVAVVGLGVIGKVHVKALKELEKETEYVKLVAVVDQISALAEDIAKQYGVIPYSTIDDALRNPEIDVITIATPSYLHSPQAILAMEYGKNVITEKPMATTLAGAKEMIKKAEKNGVKLGVIFQERYSPDIRKLKYEIIDKLGKLYLLEAELKWYRDEKEYYLRDEIARSWRGMWNTEGGGVLTNQGIHTIDLLLWLGGEVEEVSGFIDNLTHPSIEVEDTAVAIFKFKNRALGTMSQTVSMRPKKYQNRKIRIYGDRGYAEIIDRQIASVRIEGNEEMGSSVLSKSDTISQDTDLHKELFKDFLKALSEERNFPIDGKEGIKSLEVIKAIYLSSMNRQVIKLPLEVNIVI
ncbi:Gfo/Idh/MocA family protein [Saccharolobus caldissimus]|uniref:Oxidoreductase n=1 Tax=Saccharolobus caldissimus TaxID=1702097 RepID=A0AAQ4CW14_9CREN|nr:Gfo/Idh/MocA family oxidoreductase [Saccharolobus caldissimus]BDB99995.1 oxidoreductase [Saccharolobus caldissimus]